MADETFKLVIGDKNYSSWSLRPWLLMTHANIPFSEVSVRLRQPDTREQILKYSPSGQVPALLWRDIVVPDSLAICETLAELFPEKGLLPSDPLARARARSAAAEMHSGFMDLRREMPMDIVGHMPGQGHTPEALAAAQRVNTLWAELRETYGRRHPEDKGFLFGRFGVADAMYAPVVTRFATYEVKPEGLGDRQGLAAAYMQTILRLPAMQLWAQGAKAEMQARGTL